VEALEQVVQEISLFDIFIEWNGADLAGERVFDISVLYSVQQLFDLLVSKKVLYDRNGYNSSSQNI
jgi:hypothetical protein